MLACPRLALLCPVQVVKDWAEDLREDPNEQFSVALPVTPAAWKTYVVKGKAMAEFRSLYSKQARLASML